MTSARSLYRQLPRGITRGRLVLACCLARKPNGTGPPSTPEPRGSLREGKADDDRPWFDLGVRAPGVCDGERDGVGAGNGIGVRGILLSAGRAVAE